MSIELLTSAKKIQVEVSWVVMPCSIVVGYQHFRGLCCLHLWSEDGGSMVLQNVDIPSQCYMASQPRRPQLE